MLRHTLPLTADVSARLLARAATEKKRALHIAADGQFDAFYVAVRFAFNRGRKAVKSASPKTAADVAANAVKRALLDVMPGTLTTGLLAGARVAAAALPKHRAAAAPSPVKLTFSFNKANPKAVDWAKQHGAELATNISDTTRDDIARAVADAIASGDDPESAIYDAVGDDARAELIARTEIMTAVNEGQRQAWDQAVDDGLLSKETERVWIATDDACDECAELDGETAALDDEYPEPGGDGPPLHPNCRCTEGIRG